MILCGGSGERLWPASRPWRPKPFLPLTGERSSFQEAVLRAAPLGDLTVLGGAGHAALIAEQLAAVQAAATLLLEPEGRDTCAAIAVVAAWAAARDPEAVVVILPADHHIPDATAFRAAVNAALDDARAGRIVTLGLRPTGASQALGYIQPGPGDGAVKPIAAFVEKPDAESAVALVEAGALWNSGVFLAKAATLRDEIARRAPQVAAAAAEAVATGAAADGVVRLGPALGRAPRIAFDRAVMERTERGAVLPADFAWSDLGAWDSVLAALPHDEGGNALAGDAIAPASSQVLVRAAPGVQVAVVGASRLAVVAERDAVLVCDLDHAQAVRGGAAAGCFASLQEAARGLGDWLRTAALPLWATVGVDPSTGAFREALTWAGRPHDPRRRGRVQARQAFVFASAAAEGLPGPWARTATDAFAWFTRMARREDGLYATTLDPAGATTDGEARLYEHAFILLALAALGRPDEAGAVRRGLDALRHGAGGFRERGPDPFQANAHMHLLEAAIAWEAAGGGVAWAALADEIVQLALTRFIDPATGVLHEFFDGDWRALAGEADLIEPGHMLEWAWLLAQRGQEEAARRLFAAARRGFDPARGVVVNALHPDLSVRDAAARLWPQTEHLKAALILNEPAAALEAANALAVFLDTPTRGVWRERMDAQGGFLDEPSPATSLYHLYLAIRELTQVAGEPC